MIIFVYSFEDGTILRLIDQGLTLREVFALESIHGKCVWEKTNDSK